MGPAVPAVPQHVSGGDACLAQQVYGRVNCLNFGEQCVAESALQRSYCNQDLHKLLVAAGGAQLVECGASSREKRAGVGGGSLISIDDHRYSAALAAPARRRTQFG